MLYRKRFKLSIYSNRFPTKFIAFSNLNCYDCIFSNLSIRKMKDLSVPLIYILYHPVICDRFRSFMLYSCSVYLFIFLMYVITYLSWRHKLKVLSIILFK